jgi:hypothetical protein
MMAYTCNPSIWEAEAEESKVQGELVGQIGLQNKTLSQTTKNKKKRLWWSNKVDVSTEVQGKTEY